MRQRLTSRKFLLALASAIAIFSAEMWGYELSIEAIVGILGSVTAFVFGEAAVDHAAVKAQMQDLKLDALDQAVLNNMQMQRVISEATREPIVTPPIDIEGQDA